MMDIIANGAYKTLQYAIIAIASITIVYIICYTMMKFNNNSLKLEIFNTTVEFKAKNKDNNTNNKN